MGPWRSWSPVPCTGCTNGILTPLVLPWVIYLVDCVVQTGIYRSSISLDLLQSLDLPRHRSTSYRWISRAFHWSSPHRWISCVFWIFLAFCRPRSCRWNSRAFVDRRPTSVSRALHRSARSSLDLPRLRSPASFTLELHYYRVLPRHSIEPTRISLDLNWCRVWCWRSEQWRKSGQNIILFNRTYF